MQLLLVRSVAAQQHGQKAFSVPLLELYAGRGFGRPLT